MATDLCRAVRLEDAYPPKRRRLASSFVTSPRRGAAILAVVIVDVDLIVDPGR
jgi:hypothetical protein